MNLGGLNVMTVPRKAQRDITEKSAVSTSDPLIRKAPRGTKT